MRKTSSSSSFLLVVVAVAILPGLAKANNAGDFSGGVAIGTSYAGVDAAPTNGLIVQGAIGIGSTSPGYVLDVVGEPRFSAAGDTVEINNTAASNVGTGIRIDRANAGNGGFFVVNGSNVGSISFTSTTTSYNTTSDRRLKMNIKPTTKGLDDLMKITVQDFDFVADRDNVRRQGFIAQDLYRVYPEAVTVGGADPKSEPWSVDYGRLTPLLVRAVQDLTDQVQAQATEIHRLKTEIESMRHETADQ